MTSSNTMVLASSQPRSPGLLSIGWNLYRHGSLHYFMSEWHRQGDLARLNLGPYKLMLAAHPEHVRQVYTTRRESFPKGPSWEHSRKLLIGDGLIASNGKLWKRQRRLMSPFFTPRSVEQYHAVVAAASEATSQRWEAAAKAGTRLDIFDEMARVTAIIILRSMFGMDVSDETLQSVAGDVEQLILFASRRERWPFKPPMSWPLPSYRRYHRARARVAGLISDLIKRRRALPPDAWPSDLLSKLMLARDEETGEVMSDQLLHDEAIGVFIAGHETTARTRGFFFYALHQHPDVAERVHAELATQIDGVPSPAQLQHLPYTARVLKEVLRLYPPTPLLPRDPIADLDFNGVQLSPDTYLMLFLYATHRHPDFWEEPERFDPDRFLPGREEGRHPFAYAPFGGGQRICLGSSFAMLEAQVLSAVLARRFHARFLPEHQPQIEFGGTLMVLNGLPMVVERRRT